MVRPASVGNVRLPAGIANLPRAPSVAANFPGASTGPGHWGTPPGTAANLPRAPGNWGALPGAVANYPGGFGSFGAQPATGASFPSAFGRGNVGAPSGSREKRSSFRSFTTNQLTLRSFLKTLWITLAHEAIDLPCIDLLLRNISTTLLRTRPRVRPSSVRP